MNILILQGSPRANGNTSWMAEECRKAAEAAGHKVTLVNVTRKVVTKLFAKDVLRNQRRLSSLISLIEKAAASSRNMKSQEAALIS